VDASAPSFVALYSLLTALSFSGNSKRIVMPVEGGLRLRPIHQVGERCGLEQVQVGSVQHPSFDGENTIVARAMVTGKTGQPESRTDDGE
jgi:hypothetical protein